MSRSALWVLCAVLLSGASRCGSQSGSDAGAGNGSASSCIQQKCDAGRGAAGAAGASGGTGAAAGGAGGAKGGLHWYTSCGAPVCGTTPDPFDDPNTPNCGPGEVAGELCQNDGERCDGVASCGATLLCAASDPLQGPGGCPRSRAAYKQDIEYLGQSQLRDYHDQLMSIPLASYAYRHTPSTGRQLGFIIDDVEPSAAAAGDRVNLYGYLSMAVAAIQVQDKQIEALRQQVSELRERLEGGASSNSCTPYP